MEIDKKILPNCVVQVHKTLSCPHPQPQRGPQPLPPGDSWCQVPPLWLREPPGAGGPQPQLRPHPSGDPRPPAGAAGLPAHLPPGEESHHRGVHVCHSSHPPAVLGGISGSNNIRKKKFLLWTPRRRDVHLTPQDFNMAFPFQIWANYLLKVLILAVVNLWILEWESQIAGEGVKKGGQRKSFVCNSEQGGSKAVLFFIYFFFFIASYISLVTQTNDSFKSCPWQ